LLASVACGHSDETPGTRHDGSLEMNAGGGAGAPENAGRGGDSGGQSASANGGSPTGSGNSAGSATQLAGAGGGGRSGAGGAAGGTSPGGRRSDAGASGGAPRGGSANGGAGNDSAGRGGGTSGGAPNGGAGTTAGRGGGAGSGSLGTPAVRIVGRTEPGASGSVKFSWPGVNVQARFSGTQVSMNVNDGNNKNRFTVVVDGGTPKTLTTSSGQSSLALATGLGDGDHDLVVWRNTEASMGVTEFGGLTSFSAGGGLLAPAVEPDRRIEVIGDSLSVGAGVEGTSTTCSPNIDAFTNNYLAYGSVAARSVGADVVTIAWSGIGVYRSYSASDPTMPARYDFAVPNDQSAWDFSAFSPQAVIVNLGTNDFGSGNPGQPYVDAYVAFVEHVRTKYATARFVLIDMYGGDRATALNQVITGLAGDGESNVELLSFSSVPNNNTACNQHPNEAAQQAMGDLLAARLRTSLGW